MFNINSFLLQTKNTDMDIPKRILIVMKWIQ